MDQRQIVNGLVSERTGLRAFLAGLDDGSWERESLCEGWTVRDVVAHIAGNCADVMAGRLDGVGSPAFNQRQVDERRDRSPAEVLAEWDETAPKVEALYAGLPPEVWDRELPGMGTVGRGVLRQLEDLWVHAQDIRIPLAAAAVPGPGLEATLEMLARTLAERCARLTPDVGRVTLTAGEFSAVVECAPRGEDVVVEGGPVGLALVATGRVPLSVALEEGNLTVVPEPPAGFADAINIYGP